MIGTFERVAIALERGESGNLQRHRRKSDVDSNQPASRWLFCAKK